MLPTVASANARMAEASVLVANSRAASTAPRGTARPSTSAAPLARGCSAARRAFQVASSTASARRVAGGTTPTKASATTKAPKAYARAVRFEVVGACTMSLAASWLATCSACSSLWAKAPSVETSKRARKTETQRATFGAASTSPSSRHCSRKTSSIVTARPPSPALMREAEWMRHGSSLRSCGWGPAIPSKASDTLHNATARARRASGAGAAPSSPPTVPVVAASAVFDRGCGPTRSRIRAASNQQCSRALI
mmetsp:Transcript_26052/g.81217  ORF Transcript_26052/g.81217 Transcript_26052/m.81217 type:complete len:253 (-) Transcript_26052:287-1045(-)